MLLMTRKRALSILLMLVLCNTVFVAHAASHLSDELVSCELCLAHTPLSHGLAQDVATPPISSGETVHGERTHQSTSATPERSTFARGPPPSIQ